jgi:hypothetical protein
MEVRVGIFCCTICHLVISYLAGASSAWKDANWPAANLLTVLKRAASAADISLHIAGHCVHGDYEIARYLVRSLFFFFSNVRQKPQLPHQACVALHPAFPSCHSSVLHESYI